MRLDGDDLRFGLNKDLTFTDAARIENIRRTAEVAKLMLDAGLIVICSLISPFRRERMLARQLVEADEFSRSSSIRPWRNACAAIRKGSMPARSPARSPFHRSHLALRAAGGAEIHLRTDAHDADAWPDQVSRRCGSAARSPAHPEAATRPHRMRRMRGERWSAPPPASMLQCSIDAGVERERWSSWYPWPRRPDSRRDASPPCRPGLGRVLTPILAYLVFALAVCLLIVAGIQHASDPDQLVAMMTQAMATY